MEWTSKGPGASNDNVICLTSLGTKSRPGHHHVSKQHLPRYLSEFYFRYNARKLSDAQRTIMAILGVGGRRLMYRDSVA